MEIPARKAGAPHLSHAVRHGSMPGRLGFACEVKFIMARTIVKRL